MKKHLLLLGAALMATAASAETYGLGEAFSYDFTPGVFQWNVTGLDGDLYQQYPFEALKGQAILEHNLGFTSMYFSQNLPIGATPETCLEACPAVQYPADGEYAVVMQAPTWWAYGNFNFALPQMGEPCRVRVVYNIDTTVGDPAWCASGNPATKPVRVKLMSSSDQEAAYPEVETLNPEFYSNPGWRVAEFVSNLDIEGYYLSILWDAGGLSCGRNIPFYVREVSVVPVSKLPGYVAPEGDKGVTVVKDAPEVVKVSEDGAGVENVAADANAPVEYFNLQGMRVAEPANGIFIRRQGNKTTKVAL